MKTYQQLTTEKNIIETQINIINTLVECGLPKTTAHLMKLPVVGSGYSMGEYVNIYCNGKRIAGYNNCGEYAKSCRYRAKHGQVILNFSKKELKMLLEYSQIDNSDPNVAKWQEYKAFVVAHIDYSKSTMKAKEGKHVYIDTKTIEQVATNNHS